MEIFYNFMGHALIIINLIGYILALFPSYRKAKFEALKKMGSALWHEQLVTAVEIIVGVVLVTTF